MFKEPAVFIDIETNGGMHKRGRIIEVAAIRVENGEIVDTFTTLVNPGQRIPDWIVKLTGINQSDLDLAPSFNEIAHQLNQILEGAIFVAHNVRFDYSLIKRQLEEAGYSYNPKLFCTVRLSRHMYPEHKGHSLEKIINRHDIRVSSRHRAYDDAWASLEFTKLAIAEKGIEEFERSYAIQLKKRSTPPNLAEDSVGTVSNNPGVYIFEDQSGTPIYIGKSKNLKKRVMSHFSSDVRIPKEMRISFSTYKMKTIETDSEVEALLLESQLIKEHSPLYNVKLRRRLNQIVLVKHTDESGYATVVLERTSLEEVENPSNIYGVFQNKSSANEFINEAVKKYSLCPKLLGLEKSNDSCFLYQLGKCKGACVGEEAPTSYNIRLELALLNSKVSNWPFKSAIKLLVSKNRSILVNQWIVRGIYDGESDESSDSPIINKFDLDTYKILKSFIRNNPAAVQAM